MQELWKAWLAALAILLVVFFGAVGATYVGSWMQPQTPKWIATYTATQQPNLCARGYINGDPCDIVEAPYKDGHLYQIWYDNTVFWHYESQYQLPHVTMFTNGNWSFLVESYDFA